MIQFTDKFVYYKYFYLFGSLNMKNPLLIICGHVLKAAALDKVMCICGLHIVGHDSLVIVNNLIRAKHQLQIKACAIH